jgi:curved DNA-binding protein CbpA
MFNRILQLTKTAIITIDPNKFVVTNTFPYDNITNIVIDEKNPTNFSFDMEKITYTYSCHYRAHLLCHLYECLLKYSSMKLKKVGPVDAARIRKSGIEQRCKIIVHTHGITETDIYNTVIQEYKWYNITKVGHDESNYAFYFEYSGRMKVFVAADFSQIVNAIRMQIRNVGCEQSILFVENQKLSAVIQSRDILYSSIPVAVSVFEVNKLTKRHSRPIPRQIHISEEYLLEMDSAGFQPVSFHAISSIYALVRSWDNHREFRIEFDNGSSSKYTSAMRDTLLAMLLDVCRASGNLKVIVTGEISDGLRLMPRFAEEAYQASLKDTFFGSSSIETWYLSKLSKQCKTNVEVDPLVEICCELNTNIQCPGISPSADANLVKSCLAGLLIVIQNEVIKSYHSFRTTNARAIVIMLQTVYRIIPSIHGFKSFLEVKEVDTRNLLYQLLKYDHDFVNYWILEIYMSLCRCPYIPRNMQQEYVNKQTLIFDKSLLALIDLLSNRLSSFEDGLTTARKSADSDDLTVSTTHNRPTGGNSVNDDKDSVTSPAISQPAGLQSNETHQSTFSPNAGSNTASNTATNRKYSEDQLLGEPEISDDTLTYLDAVHFVPNSLVVIATAALLESIVCSKKDTTSPELFAQIIDFLAERCEVLIIMLRSNSFIIMENAAILMFILMKHRPTVHALIKELALSECLVLKHFYNGVFSPSSTQRFISRFLVATWMNGSMKSNPAKALLHRIIPSGLIEYLKFEPISEEHRVNLDLMEDEFYGNLSGGAANHSRKTKSKKSSKTQSNNENTEASTSGILMQQRMRNRITGAIKDSSADRSSTSSENISNKPARIPENYRVMFHVMTQDHKLPDLIWNEQTRQELRSSLENEIKEYDREQRLLGSKKIAWNFQQFSVKYESLGTEMKVGPIYIKYFLEAGDSFLRALNNPNHVLLFEKLFRRILVNIDINPNMAILCTKCLCRLYEVCADIIGSFDDMIILVKMLEQAANLELQQYLFDLLIILSKDQTNLLQLLEKTFVNIMVKYVSLAHINPDQIGNVLARATANVLMITSSEKDGFSSSSSQVDNSTGNTNQEKSEEEVSKQFRKSLWVPDDFACPKVWFVAPPRSTLPPPKLDQKGPYRVSELLDEIESGRVSVNWIAAPSTTEEADDESFVSIVDTGRWKPIHDIFQLRLQMLFPGRAIYSPAQISFKGLQLLQKISSIHKSSNTKGIPFYPLPLSKRIMSEQHHLTVFAQLLLSNDPNVVDTAAEILKTLVEYNYHANSKLYLTGAFFFASRYSGNNFHSIAQLFAVTHLKQSFHDSAASMAKELPVHVKSILGSIFPPAMVSILNNYGPEKFASLLVGDFDSPEVIWNSRLRQHMIEMINQHLSDFPFRLKQFTLLNYDYCPIPKIHYSFLEKEIYVYEYYLKNLCNEIKFPNWPIAEPLVLLKECLERWRYEMAKDNIDTSIEEAKKTLGLTGKKKLTTADLRKAYKNLARIYHPDKNPAGREMFEKIHVAYELLSLQELNENEINYENIILLMKTQIILYRRFASFISKQKYPCYSLVINVLSCIPLDGSAFQSSIPAEGKVGLSEESSNRKTDGEENENEMNSSSTSSSSLNYTGDLLYTASSLLYYTTYVSPLNAAELVVTENGLLKLYELFHFAIRFSVDSSATAAEKGEASPGLNKTGLTATEDMNIYQKILLNCAKTFVTISNFEEGRDEIHRVLTSVNEERLSSSFIEDLYRLLAYYKQIPLIVENVIEIISRLCSHSVLQKTFLTKAGVVWRLVPFLLNYDNTTNDLLLTQSGKSDSGPMNPMDVLDESQRISYNQYSSNILAILSAKALGRLGGYMFDDLLTESNPSIKEVLSALLTPSVAILLRNRRPWDLLNSLNENVESTTKIWNITMRKELMNSIKSTDASREKGFHDSDLLQIKEKFVYSNLKDELFLAGVYIRVFNKTHDISDIEDPTDFCEKILEFIGNILVESYSPELNLKLDEESKEIENGKEKNTNENQENQEKNDASDEKIDLQQLKIKEIYFNTSITPVQRIYLDHVVESLKVLMETRNFIIHDLLKHPHGLFVLFALLNHLSLDSDGFHSLSQIFVYVCSIQEFISATAQYQPLVAWRLLKCLCNSSSSGSSSSSNHNSSLVHESFQNLWNATEAFASNSTGLSILLSSGLVIRLLGTLIGAQGYTHTYQFRLFAISLLTKCLWNNVKGSETSFILRRFLPEPLILLLKKSIGKASLQCIDQVAENPELIWTQEMQNELRQGIIFLQKENLKKYRRSSEVSSEEATKKKNDIYSLHEILEIPSSDFYIEYQQLLNELYIGNVYIRIYLKSPTFKLSNPIYFMEKLIEFYDFSFNLQVPRKKGTNDHPLDQDPALVHNDSREIVLGKEDFLSLVTSSMICNMKNEHNLIEQMISWGFVDTLIKDYLYRINSYQRKGVPLTTILRLLNEIMNFNISLDYIIEKASSVSTNNIISNLTYALIDEDSVTSPASVEDNPSSKGEKTIMLYKESILIIEILKKLFQYYQNASILLLLNYAMQCQLPNLLISHIVNRSKSDLSYLTNPNAVKILTVDILKAMLVVANDEMHDELTQILNTSKEWKQFRDQSHDLFITVR